MHKELSFQVKYTSQYVNYLKNTIYQLFLKITVIITKFYYY